MLSIYKRVFSNQKKLNSNLDKPYRCAMEAEKEKLEKQKKKEADALEKIEQIEEQLNGFY